MFNSVGVAATVGQGRLARGLAKSVRKALSVAVNAVSSRVFMAGSFQSGDIEFSLGVVRLPACFKGIFGRRCV